MSENNRLKEPWMKFETAPPFHIAGEDTAIANELNHRTTYAYDAVQRIVSRQFASGDVTTYVFDDAGRETSRVYADSKRITFAYDHASNLTTMTDWNGVTTMVYDAIDDVTGKRDNFGNYQGYTFDAAGQNTALRLQNGFVDHLTSYTYDSDGRSSGYYDLNGDYTTIQYDARNLKTTVTHPSGYLEVSGFDNDHRQTSQISEAGMDTLQDFAFGYDAAGNRNSVFDAVLAVTTTYTFDAGDRITLSQANASLAHTFTYAYDSRGNIINSSESGVMVTSTYDAASRLVTSTRGSAVTTYTFDTNGNMTQVQEPSVTRNFSYDKENRVTQGGGLSQTFYNGFGEMISSEDENFGITAQICWDMSGNLVMQSNDVADEYFPYIVVDGRVYWDSRTGDYMVDALGSVTGIMSSSAKQTQDYRYAPYGRMLLSNEGGGQALVYRYVGSLGVRYTAVKYLENHMRARIFSVTTSQFTTRDALWPEELAYGYVNGNPVTWVDPSGNGGDWNCGDPSRKPDPCRSYDDGRKPWRRIQTPCGPIMVPPFLRIPVTSKDKDAWCCWERSLRNAKGGFGYCWSQMAVALANIQAWLQRGNYPQKDKIAHCVIGCFAQKAVDSCCAYYLAIHMENKFFPPGNQSPADYRATIEGMRCGETLELPGWLWGCRWIPGLNQGVREVFYDACFDCCMHKFKTGVLPFD